MVVLINISANFNKNNCPFIRIFITDFGSYSQEYSDCIFPVTELNERLNQIDNNPNFYNDTYIGNLVFNGNGEVEFVISNDKPIRDFPTKDNKVAGAIEIFTFPEKDSNGKIPNERYIAGCLKEGEYVNTNLGFKRVEEVTINDKLINIDGQEVKIHNLQRYYNNNKVYR